MRFGVPRFGFNDKKAGPNAESTPKAQRPAPQVGLPAWARPKATPTEPEWGAPIIEVNDQAQPQEPDYGHPIIEVNPNAVTQDELDMLELSAEVATAETGSLFVFPEEPPPVVDREWGLEALAAETALEPDAPRYPSIADLANCIAEQTQREDEQPPVFEQAVFESAFEVFERQPDPLPEPTVDAAPEPPLTLASEPEVESTTDWPSLADRLSAYHTPVDAPTMFESMRVWDREEAPATEAYPTAEVEPVPEWPERVEATADLVTDPAPVEASTNGMAWTAVTAEPDQEPESGLASPQEPLSNEWTLTLEATAEPEARYPLPVDLDATPVLLPSVESDIAMVAERADAMEEPPTQASTEGPAEKEIASLQGLALAEELQTVSGSLWAYKQYLEQFQGQLQREVSAALDAVGQQLTAFEEQSALLRREFTVGLDAADKLNVLELNGQELSQAVRAIDQARLVQSKQVVMAENLAAITQRYGDLLEKVALFEGNLKRYMKQVDGNAKQRLRETSRQEFFASSAIIRSQEMERARIAREIHDGPAQAIANVILRLDLVEKMMQQKPELVGREFAKMKEIAQGALNEIRGFIFDLRPMTLQDLGLTATLKKIVQSNQALSECHFEFIVEGAEAPLSANQELAIFRIAQEALTNVKKHALANNAYVHLKYLPNEVVLIVEDDGNGFDVHKSSTGEYTHFGLIGMQERAEDIDGDLQVISQKGRGTKVIFSLRTG